MSRKVNKNPEPKKSRKTKRLLRLCSVEGCGKEHKAKGFCNPHYRKFLKYGDPNTDKRLTGDRLCSIDGCERKHAAKGLCKFHHQRLIRNGDPNVSKRPRIKRKGNLKQCSGPCGRMLEEESYPWKIKEKGERGSFCKECMKEYHNQYYEENKKEINKKKRDDYKELKNNPVRYEKRLKQGAKYREENKEKIAANQKEWIYNKLKNDAVFRFMKNISIALNRSLKNNGISKNKKRTQDILQIEFGITPNEIKAWLTIWCPEGLEKIGKYNAKTWDDNDQSTWTYNLDHIIPQSILKFDSFDHPNFKRCWHPLNLRLIPAKENIKKGNQLPHRDVLAQIYIFEKYKVFESWLSDYRASIKDQEAK